MNPPLRTEKDIEALVEGIADGTVDCLATDHAPHNPNEKMLEFDCAPFGIIGLETALSLALTQLYHTGKISLKRLVELFSTNPAKIINKSLGTLKVGAEADVTVFGLDHEWVYDVNQTLSKSRNSPFHGTKLKGRVTTTIMAGKVVYQAPQVR